MREIKFRAWYEGGMIFSSSVLEMMFEDGHYFEHSGPHGDVSIMQYTGLHDKSGREIYEGDIVKWKWLGNEEQGDVRWDDDMAQFFAYDRTGRMLSATEVIGNIYEHPELLNS